MGISVIPSLLEEKPVPVSAGPKTLGEIAEDAKLYRHPDSALISYPLVVQKPLGIVNKKLKIAIVGAGIAGIAALYELCNLKNSSQYIEVTVYESDPDNFAFHLVSPVSVTVKGLKAGRISAALSSDKPNSIGNAVYEIGAMRFPEIAGLMWHYARILYGDKEPVDIFPNPGAVPTEMVHGDRVDRFGNGQWLDPKSPTKQVVDIVRGGLFGQEKGRDTSLFRIGGKDPAKISFQLKHLNSNDPQLSCIFSHWKLFAKKYDELTLGCAVKQVIERDIDRLPNVDGLLNDSDKINYYVELFGTIGFGTGGFKPLYNISLTEMMRLLLWNYSNEYLLPSKANYEFVKDLYLKALEKNSNVQVKLARVCDVAHIDGNSEGEALVVYYDIINGNETHDPVGKEFNYVILTSTPRQTSKMISRIGFKNVGRLVTLGDFGRTLEPKKYQGTVRPALILSDNEKFETANSKIYTAVNNVHMVSSSKIFATVKKADFDKHAPQFKEQGKIKAIVSDCGLGSSYVVPSTILDQSEAQTLRKRDYYSFLISYAWEDVTKRLQHQFTEYPLNIRDTDLLMKSVINRTIRDVHDPEKNTLGLWWFGEALSKTKLEDPLSYDWTTFTSAGAFKLDSAGEHYNTNLMFRYHTHALKPKLNSRFFLANDSYSHLGGWIEGALMSAVNAVCGLVVAANGGDVKALSNTEAEKVLLTLDNVVEDGQ